MRVHVFPSDDRGCGHYRLIWPAMALHDQGHDVTLHEPGPMPVAMHITGGRKNMQAALVNDVDFDVAVVQRPSAWQWQIAIPLMQHEGVKVIVDLDDDLSCLHHAHVMFPHVNPVTSPNDNYRHLSKATSLADLVTVTTPGLAHRYAPHGRVRILPNCVPEKYLSIGREPGLYGRVTVGWPGSIGSHPGDIDVVNGAIGRAMRGQTRVSFQLIGDPEDIDDVQKKLGLDRPPKFHGGVSLGDYPKLVAQLDVGIAPLEVNKFNTAKSWLKPLEFAALGVPFVASPTEQYKALHREGAGLIAERPRDWEKMVGRLIRDESARVELAAAGREVAARWTVEANAWRWAEAWTASCP